MPLLRGVLFDEATEAEALVIPDPEPAHAIHASLEVRGPLAELRGRRVVPIEAFVDSVGGQLPRFQGQKHSGRIERIKEAIRVTDADPPVAGRVARMVRVFFLHVKAVAARPRCDPPFDLGAAIDLLEVNGLVIRSVGAFEQIVEPRNDSNAYDVVVQRDVPEPAFFPVSL